MDCMDLLNSWLTTIFGTAVGFFLALYANRLIEKKAEGKKSLEDRKLKLAQLSYLKSVLNGLVNQIVEQSKYYSTFSDNIKSSPYEVLEPQVLASFDLLRLRNLNNTTTKEAYFSFFNNSPTPFKDYSNLFAYGDYMYRVFNSTEKQIFRAAKFKHKDQLEIRDTLLEAATLLGVRMKRLIDDLGEVDATQSKEGIFINELAAPYAKIISGPIDFEFLDTDFNTPLLANAISIIQDQTLAERLFFLAKRISNRLQHIKHNALLFAKDMKEFEEDTREAMEYFKKVMEEIDQLALE